MEMEKAHVEITVDKIGRFDYIKYDDLSIHNGAAMKKKCEELEFAIEKIIQNPRHKALALTALESCYMWIGKGLRDDQFYRNNEAQLQEKRGNE